MTMPKTTQYGPVRYYVADISEGIPCIVEGPFATEGKAFSLTLCNKNLRVIRAEVQTK